METNRRTGINRVVELIDHAIHNPTQFSGLMSQAYDTLLTDTYRGRFRVSALDTIEDIAQYAIVQAPDLSLEQKDQLSTLCVAVSHKILLDRVLESKPFGIR